MMATVVRKIDPVVEIVAAGHNALKAQIGAGAFFHLDKSERTVTAANASSLATSLTLLKEILSVYAFHLADTVAHKVADTTNVVTSPAPTDLTTAITAANELKGDYNAHIASTTFHYNADATNTIAAANASDQSTLNTLLNEIKADFNAHMASGPAAASFRLVDA
jgi:hypothetical protein